MKIQSIVQEEDEILQSKFNNDRSFDAMAATHSQVMPMTPINHSRSANRRTSGHSNRRSRGKTTPNANRVFDLASPTNDLPIQVVEQDFYTDKFSKVLGKLNMSAKYLKLFKDNNISNIDEFLALDAHDLEKLEIDPADMDILLRHIESLKFQEDEN